MISKAFHPSLDFTPLHGVASINGCHSAFDTTLKTTFILIHFRDSHEPLGWARIELELYEYLGGILRVSLRYFTKFFPDRHDGRFFLCLTRPDLHP